MEDYIRFTKSEEINGETHIECAFSDTEKCSHDCSSCSVARAILTQLWAFEEAISVR